MYVAPATLDDTRNQKLIIATVFSYYCKLVKTIIKINRFSWLKSMDNNLRSQPKDFVDTFLSLKRMITVTKFKIGETVVTEPLIYC
jgi:hypothetical protein